MKTPALFVALMTVVPSTAVAQGVSMRVGHVFDDGGLATYQLTWNHSLFGPFGTQLGGLLMSGPASSDRRLGLSADATMFRGGSPGPYIVGGLGAGASQGGYSSLWRSWSAGLGFELLPVSAVSLGVEARWRSLLPERREGAELSFRIGADFGSTRRAARDEPGNPAVGGATRPSRGLATALRGNDETASALALEVIEIAESHVGTPYRYGGSTDDGFDCSGLIQYAYREIGIELPRRSVDQAKAGREISRSDDALQPGDILTFAERGSRVTHVGLYMGDGRFIHSASKGVQISRLDQDDPYGRWWFQRWVGVRRVLPAAG